MSTPRFFAPALDPGDDIVDLPRDEAEHLTRVLRMGVGDTVAVFDGRGVEFDARVVMAERHAARVELLRRVEPAPESSVALTLVQAVLKGDKMDDIVRDAVMMGVSTVQPMVTTRAETTLAVLQRGARVERWRRIALASVKQSRRAVLPDINVPVTFDRWLAQPPVGIRLMFVEPGLEGATPLARLRDTSPPAAAEVVIGPEGGWEPRECEVASRAGVQLVSLGGRTLRSDAVPVAALSVLQFLWDTSC